VVFVLFDAMLAKNSLDPIEVLLFQTRTSLFATHLLLELHSRQFDIACPL